MEKNKIRLNIGGAEFAISTPDDPAYVEKLADEISAKISRLVKETPRLSVTMAAILTALDYCDCCKKAEESADHLRGQIKDYLEDSARARMEADVARREIERLNREIQQLRAQTAGGKRSVQ